MVARPKVVAATETYNEEGFLPYWLAGVDRLVDEIVAIDDGSDDRSVEILEAHPKVVDVVRKRRGKRTEVKDLNRLVAMARARGADWCMLLDADEVFDARMQQRLPELVSREGVGEYWFRKLWLWRDMHRYRTDRAEKFAQWNPKRLFRMTPQVRFRYPGGLHVRVASTMVRRTRWTPQFGNGGLAGAGPVSQVDDVFLLHLAAVDWADMTRKHLQYAVNKKVEYPRKAPDEIVTWAYDSLDETSLTTARVAREWGMEQLTADAEALRKRLGLVDRPSASAAPLA